MPNFINCLPFRKTVMCMSCWKGPAAVGEVCLRPKTRNFALSKSLLTGLTYPHD
jgi:hypothetical protein